MNPKKAMMKFMRHVAAAPAGALFQVGTVYDMKNGWRVYQRVGDKGLAMSPDAARGLYRSFEKQAALPQWRAVAEDMRAIFDELKSCADEAEQRNRDGVVPPDMPVVAPEAGHA